MSITDPETIRLSNEAIRPLAEQMRGLVAQLAGLEEQITRILPDIPNDPAEIVEDGREAEGISRLTGADIHALAAIRAGVLALATPEVQALVSKACVRPLRIS